MEEILQMSALELSKQIRHGSVSVKEAVEACKKQIQKSESQVHAYVSMDEKILAHRIKEVGSSSRIHWMLPGSGRKNLVMKS